MHSADNLWFASRVYVTFKVKLVIYSNSYIYYWILIDRHAQILRNGIFFKMCKLSIISFEWIQSITVFYSSKRTLTSKSFSIQKTSK